MTRNVRHNDRARKHTHRHKSKEKPGKPRAQSSGLHTAAQTALFAPSPGDAARARTSTCKALRPKGWPQARDASLPAAQRLAVHTRVSVWFGVKL
eukprot:767019-Hanusia_phi.AAC.3